jgi:hypothetical protein
MIGEFWYLSTGNMIGLVLSEKEFSLEISM